MSIVKSNKKIISLNGSGADALTRISVLENNEYKVIYYESVSAASGTITAPTNSTILLTEFQGGIDAYVSTISGGEPTGDLPLTAGGSQVVVSSFDASGNYTLSGTPSAYPVALIYCLKIKAIYWSNLDLDKIVDFYPTNISLLYGITGFTGTGTLLAKSTSPTFSGQVNIGNYASPANLRALTVGQDTAYMSFGSLVGATSYGAIYIDQATPSTSNYTITSDGLISALNASTIAYIRVLNNNRITVSNTDQSFTPAAATSGAVTTFTFTKPNNTGQTASTPINGVLWTLGTRQWATGAITTQKEFELTSPTYSFVGASTITSAYSFYVNPPVAGTNATISTAYAAGFNGRVRIEGIVNLGDGRIFSDAGMDLNAGSGSCRIFVGGAGVGTYTATTFTATPSAATSGSVSNFTFTASANTGQTASTEISNFKVNGASKTWANGGAATTIATQRWNYFTANTAATSGGGTLTISDSYGLYAERAVASGTTITRNWALGLNGSIQMTNNTTLSGIDSAGTSRDIITWSSGDNITLSGRPGVTDIYLNPTNGGIGLYVKAGGDGGIGVASPSARWHIIKTTEQLRVGYDTSNYYSTTVGSTGTVTFNAVGTGSKFVFSDNIELTQTVTTESVTSDTTVTIVINGVTYKLLAKA